MTRHYYDIKYPYFNYPLRDDAGVLWRMYTIPFVGLVEMYREQENCRPATFFDCGCASGELILQAADMGVCATGIDIKRYQMDNSRAKRYLDEGCIKICSILDMGQVNAELAYCNGTLTYLNNTTLPLALEKFKGVRMLIAIHNTTEDVRAAAADGCRLVYEEPRLIRSRKWWVQTFRKNGFDVVYNEKYQCFCATPIQRQR